MITSLRSSPRLAGVVLVALVALVPVGTAPSAVAAPSPAGQEPRVTPGDGSFDPAAGRRRPGTPAVPGGGPLPAPNGPSGPTTPRPVVKYVIACPGNSVDTPAEAVMCGQAAAACDPPRLLHWRYAAPEGQALRLEGTRCLTGAEAAAGGGEAFPGFTVDDLRRLPLPPGGVVLEPGNGYALAGVPVNAVAEAGPVLLAADVAGFAVQVRATPVGYTWDFGDGTVLGPTADPGRRWAPGAPPGGTAHTYEGGGSVGVVLTTTYAGEFSVDGGAFQPVLGTAAVASPAVPLAVLEGRGALVGSATRR